ncbi:uncharacterized protein BDV17DRAFT_294508 [Aspergillus undulatus]|uniref:uncharacterized protein n=1 Tax=Aspergillus undulatus TaxID=1810928 RepID=UPI003CCD7DC3
MSCLSSIFSCCLPTKKSTEKSEAQTPHTQTSTNSTTHHPISNHYHHDINNDTLEQSQDQNGYNAVVPLPAYTPRPTSIQEKTLEAHMRDPAISSETYHQHTSDEKQRLAWEEATSEPQPRSPSPSYNYNHNYNHTYSNFYYSYPTHPPPEEVSSDVSSAISFPSSYGNTSTATRETPPPPYSPPALSPAPSRSMSISSAYRHPPPHPSQLPMAAITQPPPVFSAGRPARRSFDEQIVAASGASRPRPGAGTGRFSWENERR